MTLEELYAAVGGDYDQALRVLRMDKLIDKHIRKLADHGVVEELIAAGEGMDPTELFERAHAAKGVCANLGLTALADAASEVTEEYRPGTPRQLSDEQVAAKLAAIAELWATTQQEISRYEDAS